jgi:glycosyltransferase involved in cell wall biosynthesis
MPAPLPLVLVSAVFPPAPMAGAPRVRAMVRYLPAHGVLPAIVATDEAELPADADGRVELHRVPHHGPPPSARGFRGDNLPWWRRLLRDLAATPDRYHRWAKQAARLAWRLARERGAPVLVSVPPVSAAWQVARLRGPADPPLLVDFRDAWLDDPIRADYYRDPLRHWREQRMEALTVRRAAACLAASPSMAQAFQRRYPDLTGRFHVLLNGYDEADWRALPRIEPLPPQALNLVYTGSFPGYQTPRYVLQALAELPVSDIWLHVVGDTSGKPEKLLREQWPQLTERVRVHPRGGHALALAWQSAADVLLLVVTPGPRGDETQMVVTSKAFEYLRSRRPILATVSPDSDLDRLLAPVSWVTRVPATDVEGLKAALLAAWERKQAGLLRPIDAWEAIEVYRRDRQMGVLVQLIAGLSRSSLPLAA